ncbi:ras GEF [Clavulina sp. PMI_390]|nr:ras GEF [Clavulina sp. PMI_390]
MSSAAPVRCLPFLVASPDDQGTLRFKICDVDRMVPMESQRERVERLLAADLSIADDGSFVEMTDGLLAHELKSLYNALSKLDPSGRRIIYSVSSVTGPHGQPLYQISYMLVSRVTNLNGPSALAIALPTPPAVTDEQTQEQHETAQPTASSSSPQEPTPPHHQQPANRGFRGSLVSFFTTPSKLRTTPRTRRSSARLSQDGYGSSRSTELPSRRSMTSITFGSSNNSSRSIPDTLAAHADPPRASFSMMRSPSAQYPLTSLLTPPFIPKPGARASLGSLAPPPSSFPSHLSSNSAASLASGPSQTSSPSSLRTTSTSSLIQSPFDHDQSPSSVHPISSAPDALYHQMSPPQRDQRPTVARPSNDSLRTTSSVDSEASNSTIRHSTQSPLVGDVLTAAILTEENVGDLASVVPGAQIHSLSVHPDPNAERFPARGQTPTSVSMILSSGGSFSTGTSDDGASSAGGGSSGHFQDVVNVMPKFESLGPMFDRQQSPIHLVRGTTETTWVGLYIPSDHVFASPNDDPRFAMYGKSLGALVTFEGKYTPDLSRMLPTTTRYADGSGRDSMVTAVSNFTATGTTHTEDSETPSADTLVGSGSLPSVGSGSALSSLDTSGGGGSGASSDGHAAATTSQLELEFSPFEKPPLMAATIERWIAQLTSQLDYEELLKFFYVYRTYITPFELLHILIYRFQWTLSPSRDEAIAPSGPELEAELTHWKEDGAIKRIIRARTCVVLRYWLSTFFAVDFLKNRRLGIMMTNWLNMVSRSRLLDKLPDAKAMLALVKDLVRQSKIIYYEEGRACTPPEERKVGDWDGNYVPLSPELLEMSPVLELLLSQDDPSRTDPRNPDVDLDFTLPLPKADIAHLKPSDDGFHDEDGDEPAPPPLTPYQKAYLRAGQHAPTMSGQMVSSIIPHSKTLTIAQAHHMTPLHIAMPGGDMEATAQEQGTSYVSRPHSKVERAMVNTLGKFNQWRNMLHPKSPFPNAPFEIVGQAATSSRLSMAGASSSTLVLSSTMGGSDAGGMGRMLGSMRSKMSVSVLGSSRSGYTPHQRSPLALAGAQRQASVGGDDASQDGSLSNDSSLSIPTIDVQDVSIAATDEEGAGEHTRDGEMDGAPQAHDTPRELAVELPFIEPSEPLAVEALIQEAEGEHHAVDSSVAAEPVESPEASELAVVPSDDVHPFSPSAAMPQELHINPHFEAFGAAVQSSPRADSLILEAVSDDEDYGEVVRSLRHRAPFGQQQPHHNGLASPPLSAFDRTRFAIRDSTASFASSVSSFGQLLPRRSLTEIVRNPMNVAPPVSPSPPPVAAPRMPPGLPPGLGGFIEQTEYDSDSDSENNDEEVADSTPQPTIGRSRRSHAQERPPPSRSDSRVSLRRQFRIDEEKAKDKAARRARRALLLGSDAEDSDDEESKEANRMQDQDKPQPSAWHMVAIHDGAKENDEMEAGDAETALRRLEGAIDPEVAKARAAKVQAMIQRAAARFKAEKAGADYTDEDQRAMEQLQQIIAEDDELLEPPTAHEASAVAQDGDEPEAVLTPLNEVVEDVSEPDVTEVDEANEGEVGAEFHQPVAPIFTLESAVATGTLVNLPRSLPPGAHTGWLPAYATPDPHEPPVLEHRRSWIMDFRSDAIARHFSIIDRDLLKNLQFDQIVSLEWARPMSEITVYDWQWFFKWDTERQTRMNEAPYRHLTAMSSVSACRARHHLMTMWTATEIILTPPNERPALVDKFIRLASKLHQQNSFASLVSIMLGLQSQPVASAMRRHWHRIGAWELRMLKELTAFTAPGGNYRKIREAIAHLADHRWLVPSSAPVETIDQDGQTVLENAKPSCIPFIQAYLGELNDVSLLPDFIDPTETKKPYHRYQPLHKPRVFNMLPQLPEEVPLRPLVNIGKQRLITSVIKDIIAGQQLASNYTLAEMESTIFIKCMMIRSLTPEKMAELTSKM